MALKHPSEVHHFNGRDGCFRALVPRFGARALDRLFDGIRREDTKNDGLLRLFCRCGDTPGGLAGNVVEVGCGATNHTTESDDGIELVALGKPQADRRKLEGSGHSNVRDELIANSVAGESVFCSTDERVHNELVEPRGDDGKACAIARYGLTFDVWGERFFHGGQF